MKFKTVAQSFGVAILVLLLRIWPFVSPRHATIYHNFLPIDSLVWGVVIELGALTLVTALLFTFLERGEAGWRTYLWALVFAALTPIVAGELAATLKIGFPVRAGQYCLYGTLLILVAMRAGRPAVFGTIVRGARLLLLLAGCSLLWMLVELVYIGVRSQPHDQSVPMRQSGLPSVAQHAGGQRILWILFDELSYRQVFEHRYPGLSLPNFDKLRAESVSFSHVTPAGYNTQEVVPSLLLGRVIKDIRGNLAGGLSVQFAGSRSMQAFDAQKTLFADARRLGWTTGVVGWYNPYCRILQGTLDSCFWRAGDGLWQATTPQNSPLKNAWAPLADSIQQWRGKPVYAGGDKHEEDLAALLPQAEALIRDQSIGFAFIHLSVPHPPGIYDRRSGAMRSSGTYLDNLALADRTLGEFMQTLSLTPAAANTTIILCSDHSWRLPLWLPTPQWTQEEAIASEGHFDPRPVLMIHYPGQHSEHDVDAPFAGVRLHDLVDEILQGQQPSRN